MKTSLSLMIFVKHALVAVLSLVVLSACGGGESVQLPRSLTFQSLVGVPNESSRVFCGTMRGMVSAGRIPYTHPCSSQPLTLFSVIRSNTELEPFKAELTETVRVMEFLPIPVSAVQSLADPSFFKQSDLLLVDAYFDSRWRVEVHSVKETVSRVEVCFTNKKVLAGGDIDSLQVSYWFAIPKTGKPVVVLPPTIWDSYDPTPTGFPLNGCPGATA